MESVLLYFTRAGSMARAGSELADENWREQEWGEGRTVVVVTCHVEGCVRGMRFEGRR